MTDYVKSAARELAERGITANLVHPPITDTGWITDEVRAIAESAFPLSKVASPESVAEVVGFLVSNEARVVTGNVIRMG